jgi:hypothetical protein
MIIDEAEEDEENEDEADDDLRLSSTPSRHNSTITVVSPSVIAESAENTSTSTSIPLKESSSNHEILPSSSSGGGTTRSLSGGGSGQPRLRKTVVVTEDNPSVDLFKENLHISDTNGSSSSSRLNEGNMNFEGESSSMKDGQPAALFLLSRRHVLIDDIQDHLEKPNTLVIFLQLPTLSIPSSSASFTSEENLSDKIMGTEEKSTKSGKSSKLMIEFEYDLLNDNLIEIVDEMLQLEEFQSNPAITRDLMMNIIQPVITYANQAIQEQEQRIEERRHEGEGNSGTSLFSVSPSKAAIERLLSSSSEISSQVSYYLLRQKYQKKGPSHSSSSSSSSILTKEDMNGSAPSTPQKLLLSSENGLSEDIKMKESPKTANHQRLNLHPTSIERNNSDDVVSSSSSQSQSISIPSSPVKYKKLGKL